MTVATTNALAAIETEDPKLADGLRGALDAAGAAKTRIGERLRDETSEAAPPGSRRAAISGTDWPSAFQRAPSRLSVSTQPAPQCHPLLRRDGGPTRIARRSTLAAWISSM